MNRFFFLPLLLASFCGTAQTDSARRDIRNGYFTVGAGAVVNTPPVFVRTGMALGNAMMASPTLVLRGGRRFSRRVSGGIRLEATLWRSKEQLQYTSNPGGGAPSSTGSYDVRYTLGRPALSIAPFLRGTFGRGSGQVVLGGFAGFVRTSGALDVKESPGPVFDLFVEGGNGLTAGLEAGYSRTLRNGLSLEVLATLQRVTVRPGGSESYLSFWAFPVTVGIARPFGRPARR